MTTLIIKSNTGTTADVLIPDLGILIPFGGGSETFTDDANIAACNRSRDLVALATDNAYPPDSTLILNDGTSDIPPADVGDFISGIPPHAATHIEGGFDQTATETPAANRTPKANAFGKIDSWVTTDAAAATPSLRRLGSTATDACPGDDARLSDARTPTTHATTHQDGGADEISVAGLSGALADPQTPTSHATTHQDGGADEISVAGLSGALADPQTPTSHATTHQDGGADEISVAGLSGALADPQTPTSHATTHQNGGADEISVAGLSGSLADPQTPTSHASTHQHGGADEVATATPSANSIPKADANGKLDGWVTATEAGQTEREPTGFEDAAADITITWSDAAKTLTVAPTGASFDLWQRGTKFTKTTEVKDISATIAEGFWFFYYDVSGVLQASQTPWDIATTAQVAIIYWDATNAKALSVWWEPHGLTMDWATHKYLHTTVNTRFRSGLATSGNVTGDGSLASHAQIAVEAGTVADEDIEINITQGTGGGRFEQDLALPAKIPVWYLDGSGPVWRVKTANSFPLMESSPAGTRIRFNEFVSPNWVLTPVGSNGDYTAVWLFATNDQTQPVIAILGQREDTSFGNAVANNTLSSLNLAGMAISEMKALARLIFQTSTAYGNTPRARLREILDLRSVQELPSGGFVGTSHGSLTGRDELNSHPATAISLDTTTFNGRFDTTIDTVQKAMDNLDDPKLNLNASNPPTVNDDSSAGYVVGSYWIDTTHDLVFVCAHAAVGAAKWSLVSGYIEKEHHRIYNEGSYTTTGNISTDAVQYTRIWLAAGTSLTVIGTYLVTGTLAGRNLILGMYNQTTPLSESGAPATKLFESTVLASTTFGNLSFVTYTLGTPYLITTTGFYWLAIASSTQLGYIATPSFPAGYAHQYAGTTTGIALPATATGLTQPAGGVIDVFVSEA